MSSTVIRYRSEDGSEWKSEVEAIKQDTLLLKIQIAMFPLGDVPIDVKDGKGWLQHDLSVVNKAKQGILDLCKEEGFSEDWPQFNEPADKVHPLSIVGRILDDSGGLLSDAWRRFGRIDVDGREHQQCYYAYTSEPEPEHICIEDRR